MRTARPLATIKDVENAIRAMAFLLKMIPRDSAQYPRIIRKHQKLSNKLERMKLEENKLKGGE